MVDTLAKTCAALLLADHPETIQQLAVTLSCFLHLLRDIVTGSKGLADGTAPWLVLGEHVLGCETLPNGVIVHYQDLATYDPQQEISKQQQRYLQGTCVAELEVKVRYIVTCFVYEFHTFNSCNRRLMCAAA